MCSITNDFSNSIGWAAGAKIYRESDAADDTATKDVSRVRHSEIDELMRDVLREQNRVEKFLDELPEFEERPKNGVVSTDRLINELQGR